MLTNTYIHIPGVGGKTELAIWESGIKNWEEYLSLNPKSPHAPHLEKSIAAYKEGDIDFFANLLPRSEHWRMFECFRDQCAFLDIETTGFSKFYDDITLIGLYDGNEYRSYIKGQNLADFERDIKKYKMLITFNGVLFDAPFIAAKFEGIGLPQAHIDLRFLFARLGYKGGLKVVEKAFGVEREESVEEVRGFEAVLLWYAYLRGDMGALEKLVKYNYEDTVNLAKLMEIGYERLSGNGNSHKFKAQKAKTTGKGELIIGKKRYSFGPAKGEKKIVLGDIMTRAKKPDKVVGIDLTGSERRPTGWALLDGDKVETKTLRTDKELVEETIKSGAKLVSIDSPLSLPIGRRAISDDSPCRKYGISRECERQLKRAGISVFWCLLPSMQSLTRRGIKLAKEFKKRGVTVIESFPGAAQDILGIPRKKTSLSELKQGLADFGIKGEYIEKNVTHDEIDAITSALVGYFYLFDHYEALGNEKEDYLIIPSLYKINGKKKLVDFLAP